jgi:hypothetical protein
MYVKFHARDFYENMKKVPNLVKIGQKITGTLCKDLSTFYWTMYVKFHAGDFYENMKNSKFG